MTAPTSAATCPACSEPATGRFCASCGTPLAGATCTRCGAALTPGAKFCHRCGTPAGTASARRAPGDGAISAAVPWSIAAIALLALIALIAGQRFSVGRGTAEPGPGAPTAAPFAGEAPGRAPDISSLSPEERADRLFDRMMRLSEQGKRDSLQLFAPMAVAAYQMLGALDLDQRYDLGRVAEVSGARELQRAQADTILRARPTHLLGLALAMRGARARGDAAAAAAFARRIVAAAPAERAANLPEYQRHQRDMEEAIAEAGRTH